MTGIFFIHWERHSPEWHRANQEIGVPRASDTDRILTQDATCSALV